MNLDVAAASSLAATTTTSRPSLSRSQSRAMPRSMMSRNGNNKSLAHVLSAPSLSLRRFDNGSSGDLDQAPPNKREKRSERRQLIDNKRPSRLNLSQSRLSLMRRRELDDSNSKQNASFTSSSRRRQATKNEMWHKVSQQVPNTTTINNNRKIQNTLLTEAIHLGFDFAVAAQQQAKKQTQLSTVSMPYHMAAVASTSMTTSATSMTTATTASSLGTTSCSTGDLLEFPALRLDSVTTTTTRPHATIITTRRRRSSHRNRLSDSIPCTPRRHKSTEKCQDQDCCNNKEDGAPKLVQRTTTNEQDDDNICFRNDINKEEDILAPLPDMSSSVGSMTSGGSRRHRRRSAPTKKAAASLTKKATRHSVPINKEEKDVSFRFPGQRSIGSLEYEDSCQSLNSSLSGCSLASDNTKTNARPGVRRASITMNDDQDVSLLQEESNRYDAPTTTAAGTGSRRKEASTKTIPLPSETHQSTTVPAERTTTTRRRLRRTSDNRHHRKGCGKSHSPKRNSYPAGNHSNENANANPGLTNMKDHSANNRMLNKATTATMPPSSPTSSSKSSNPPSPPPMTTARPTMISIAPGLEVPLRGTGETYHAVAHDNVCSLTCPSCRLELYAIQDCEYLICPSCQEIHAMQELVSNMSEDDLMDASMLRFLHDSSTSMVLGEQGALQRFRQSQQQQQRRHGLGVGLTQGDLAEIYRELRSTSHRHRHRG